jgi:heterodisulfide reductase subunit A
LQEIDLPVNKTALVIGGGIAGMTCALSIAEQNHPVYLIEKNKKLGGIAKNIRYLSEDLDIQNHMDNLISKIYKHPLIRVRTEAKITEAYGYVGNFETVIEYKNQTEKIKPEKIKHGAAVIAIGAREYKPKEYLYGKDERVVTNLQLEDLIDKRDKTVINAKNIVMIQCVGCRNEDRNYCSRVCCSESIKNGLKLKEINPSADIYILFRDIRTYGFREDYYRQAADNDIKFIRYEPEAVPEVKAIDKGLRVAAYDYILGRKIAINADIISLAAAVIPPEDNKTISRLFKVPLGPDNFFKEAHVKLRPVEFGTDGVYLCGTAHYPKHISETINQAYGAAGRVLTLLSRDRVTVSGSVCEIDEKKCIGCEACISVCSYNAIELRKIKQGGKAFVNPVLCKGDGLCNAKCPTGAISLKHFTDKEIISQIEAAA